MSHDPYLVLGLRPGASQAEIKAAYRRLVLENHPDRQGGTPAAAARFREIVAAYKAVLRRRQEPEASAMPMSQPETSSSELVESKVDLGLLGLFAGLAVAGIGAVVWQANNRAQRQRYRIPRSRP